MLMRVLNDYAFDGEIVELVAGDTVRVGERSNPDGPFPNWLYCTLDRTGMSGWVAERILVVAGDVATATEVYTSEEMTVARGDVVETICELNGWCWCRRSADGKVAWVDKGNLKMAE